MPFVTSRDFHPTIKCICLSVIFHVAAWQSSASSTVCMAASTVGLTFTRSQSDLRITDATSVIGEAKERSRGANGILLCECRCGAVSDNEATSKLSGKPTEELDYYNQW